jgi:hypothetical protein
VRLLRCCCLLELVMKPIGGLEELGLVIVLDFALLKSKAVACADIGCGCASLV